MLNMDAMTCHGVSRLAEAARMVASVLSGQQNLTCSGKRQSGLRGWRGRNRDFARENAAGGATPYVRQSSKGCKDTKKGGKLLPFCLIDQLFNCANGEFQLANTLDSRARWRGL